MINEVLSTQFLAPSCGRENLIDHIRAGALRFWHRRRNQMAVHPACWRTIYCGRFIDKARVKFELTQLQPSSCGSPPSGGNEKPSAAQQPTNVTAAESPPPAPKVRGVRAK